MTYENLKKICDELKKYIGKNIKAIYKIPNGLAFKVSNKDFLCFSYSPSSLFILDEKDIPLLEQIHLPIEGAKLLDLKLKKDDKILALKLVDLKKNKIYYLIFEITGRNSNVFILNNERKILYIFRPFQSQVRNLEVGKEYKFPPVIFDISKEKIVPFEEEEKKFLNSLRKNVLNVVNQKVKSLEKKLKNIQDQISKLEVKDKPEKYLKQAELIKSNLFKFDIDNHYKEIEVENFETGEKIKISLDPSLTLKENLDKLYKNYKKLKRKIENCAKIKKELLSKKEQIENFLYFLKTQAETNLYDKNYLKLLFEKTKKANKENIDNVFILKTKNNNLIFIGKNAKGNKKILTEIGTKNDIWFHVKDYPGSHVILKLPKSYNSLDDVLKDYEEDILFGAKCAKIFSDIYKNISVEEKFKNLEKFLKDRKKAEVDFTFLKNVKKIKGTISKVTYKNYKTLVV